MSAPPAASSPTVDGAPRRGPAPAFALSAALLGFFVITLDASVVNVALPDIRGDLGGDMSGLQWVMDAGAEGLGGPRVLVSLAITVLALVVFVAAQARGKQPMVPLNLFRSRTVLIASGTGFAFIGGFQGMVFVYSLYLQQQRGLSSFATGLAFVPMTVLSAFVSVLAARLAERYGPRVPIVGGMLLMGTGTTTLAFLPASTPAWALSFMMIPVGICGPLAMAPTTALLLESVPAHRAGVASGVFNTSRQLGGALAVAVFGALLAGRDGMLHGLRESLAITAVMAFVSAAANLFLRPARQP
ncbi:MFS transporter [Streptomyces massasporeus]